MSLSSHESDSVQTEDDVSSSSVAVYETRPGKAVFTEEDNTDGWIATDTTVELRE